VLPHFSESTGESVSGHRKSGVWVKLFSLRWAERDPWQLHHNWSILQGDLHPYVENKTNDAVCSGIQTSDLCNVGVGIHTAQIHNENLLHSVGFEVLTAVSTKMTVFWVVAPCCLVEVYERFRGPCCLHHRPDDGDGKDL
jgi:hypothetical protein